MLALALLIFSVAVYVGVKTFLTRSLERVLDNNAHNIATDFLVPLRAKGEAWFLSEMSESYPPGVSDPFVRVSQGDKVLYQSGDMRDPFVRTSALPLPINPAWFNAIHREKAPSGQQVLVYTLPYQVPGGSTIFVEAASSLDPVEHILRSLSLIMILTTPVILLAAALGGYALMSRPLRPVVVLTEQAERVGRKELGERLPIIPSGDELERLSLALNRMIERLEEALDHNHRFSADASHELRTPLTIIRGELEDLMQMPSLPPEAVEGIGSALEESYRMSRIVHSLMTISRLDCGGEKIEMLPVDLVGIARSTMDHMSLLAEEKHILLRCEHEPAVFVTGDAMRLKQVMVNLIDNAIKYTPDGGVVKVTLAAEGSLAVLTVSDTGIGIPADALPFVFDRFFRADKARTRESGGTGLGLSIVKSICGVHNGSASVQSIEGRGTIVRIDLPRLTLSPSQIEELTPAATVSQAVEPSDRNQRSSTTKENITVSPH
jgi:signal transduction histidine kinase